MKNQDKYAALMDNLILISLCLLIIGLPFSNSIIEITASIAIALWFFKKAFILRSFKIKDTPLNIPISIYFIFVALSLINTRFLMTSLTGFGFKAMEHFLLFVVIIDTVRTKADFKKLIAAILFSCALIGIDGLWQFAAGHDFIRDYPLWSSGRLTASFKFPNGFGIWLATLMPFCISLVIFSGKEKLYKVLGVFLTILLSVCLVLNFTRGAIIAALFALGFIAWKKGKIARKALILILFMAVLGISLLAFYGGKEAISAYIFSSNSIIHRISLTKLCWQMFMDQPFLGHGINTFMSIYGNYSSPELFGGVSYAHNCYLQIAVETGVFGLLAFLWVIAALFVSSLKDINRRKDGFVKACQLGLLAGLGAYLAHSAVDTNLYALQLAILFYYLLGLVISAQNLKEI